MQKSRKAEGEVPPPPPPITTGSVVTSFGELRYALDLGSSEREPTERSSWSGVAHEEIVGVLLSTKDYHSVPGIILSR